MKLDPGVTSSIRGRDSNIKLFMGFINKLIII